ncbi:MAG TPA: alpha/beta hydrolase [Candidatus Acidoferrales bacterium]|nr:alpha/beta hydrolase [Candidatus Acidoferrales bacterium]
MSVQTLDRAAALSAGYATSSDGTRIAYRRLGSGPGLVVLHGAMESGRSHLQLAEALSSDFTVLLPDRRGRGESGPYREGDVLRQEIDDLVAVARDGGAEYVFGISSGAIISLVASLETPTFRKAVIFEPPLVAPADVPSALMRRFDAEIASGDIAAALITGMKAARLAPPLFDLIPRWLLERMTAAMLASDAKRAAASAVTIRDLAPLLHYDFAVVAEAAGDPARFDAVRADVLLLGGSKSPAFVRSALDALGPAMPHAKRVELAGLSHSAAGNTADPMTGRGAAPDRVADVVRGFLETK